MPTLLRLLVPAIALAVAVVPATGQLPPLPKDGPFPKEIPPTADDDDAVPPKVNRIPVLPRLKEQPEKKVPDKKQTEKKAEKKLSGLPPLPGDKLDVPPDPKSVELNKEGTDRLHEEKLLRLRETEERLRAAEEKLSRLARAEEKLRQTEEQARLADEQLRETVAKLRQAEEQLRRLRAEAAKAADVVPEQGPKLIPTPSGSVKVVVLEDKPATPSQPAGPATLRMSADKKNAAVMAPDGTVTVFDIETGKELMAFPAKK